MAGIPLILQLNVAGLPQQWINYEKAAYYYCKGLITWTAGINEITLMGGVSRITGERSSLSMNSIIAVQGNVNPKMYQYPPTLNNRVLFRRDGNVCAYCHQTFSPKVLTRDHVHPRALGGKDKWENVVTSCKPCNNHKGDKLLKDLPIDLGYKPYKPSRAEAMLLNNPSVLDDQFDFLTKQLGPDSRYLELYQRPEAPEKLEGFLLDDV